MTIYPLLPEPSGSVDFQSELAVQFATLENTFVEGVTVRNVDGYNAIKDVWSVNYSRLTFAEMRSLWDFLTGLQGINRFLWKPPNLPFPKVWYANTLGRTVQSANDWTLTATFIEDKPPSPQPPPNDNIADAIALSLRIPFTSYYLNATTETDEGSEVFSFFEGQSIWFKYTTPEVGGDITIKLSGALIDIYLNKVVATVYTQFTTPLNMDDLDYVADNSAGNPHSISFSASANITYFIQIQVAEFLFAGSAEMEDTLVTLTVVSAPSGAPPAGALFANPITINSGDTLTVDNTFFAAEDGLPEVYSNNVVLAKPAWFKFTAPSTADYQLDTLSTDLTLFPAADTVIAVFTGADIPSLVAIASNDDDSDPTATSDLLSCVVLSAIADTDYMIAVDGYEGDAGVLTFKIQPASGVPANNNFANAAALSLGVPDTSANNHFANMEPGEISNIEFGGRTVWYKYVETTASSRTFTASGLDPISNPILLGMGIYTGTDVTSLTPVDSDGSNNPNVTVGTSLGETYYVQIDGNYGSFGDLTVEVS